MVADSLAADTLAAPRGFVTDGSRYVALIRVRPDPGWPEARFLEWMQKWIAETLAQTQSLLA